ncbi:MAG: hypothetical protein ACI3XI_00225 [Eubacteriales bacterium]
MAKKDGAMFSRSLFGYKKADVNEYIRRADAVHSGEISDVSAEKHALEEKLADANGRIAELESMLATERADHKESINKLNAEFHKKSAEAEAREKTIKEKLTESEARVASYLKLADSASSRAESAEAEVSVLSAGLDSSAAEIRVLKAEIEEKNSEIKRLTELEAMARYDSAQKEREAKDEKRKYIMIKRPNIKWFK